MHGQKNIKLSLLCLII